jgi:hypothetical protein
MEPIQQLLESLEKVTDRLENAFREDLERSREDARLLVQQTKLLAKDGVQLAHEIGVELKVETVLLARELKAHLESAEFEAQLDALIDRADGRAAFVKQQQAKSSAQASKWFALVHGSLYKDLLDFSDEDIKRERRERIGRKIFFLLQHYRASVADSAQTGALIGGVFGSRAAWKFAVAAGGLKFAWLLGAKKIFEKEAS